MIICACKTYLKIEILLVKNKKFRYNCIRYNQKNEA